MTTTQNHFETKTDYLLLTLTGHYDKADFIELPNVVLDACIKENRKKVLINGLHLEGTNVPTMDRFFIGEAVAKVIGNKVKIAMIWPEKDITKFAETVAINRGGYAFVFGSVSEGLKWLLADS